MPSQGSPESASILEYITQIDEELKAIATLDDAAGRLGKLHQIREQTRSIKFLLDSLFEQANDLEAGRDVLTRLLNRKFLPVVMARKCSTRASRTTPSVCSPSTSITSSASTTPMATTLATRFFSRSARFWRATPAAATMRSAWGEEFLLVLVDIDTNKALAAAEKLRERIAREHFRLSSGEVLQVTVSIGMAVHDGHPDYERLLQQADQALYQAKHGGRNRCVLYAG